MVLLRPRSRLLQCDATAAGLAHQICAPYSTRLPAILPPQMGHIGTRLPRTDPAPYHPSGLVATPAHPRPPSSPPSRCAPSHRYPTTASTATATGRTCLARISPTAECPTGRTQTTTPRRRFDSCEARNLVSAPGQATQTHIRVSWKLAHSAAA